MLQIKKESAIPKFIFIGSISLLILFHFIIVNYLTVPFPFWGDDLVFVDFVRRVTQGELDLLQGYYPFHGGIHANVLMKIFLLIQNKILGIINYKISVLIGQLSLGILLCYFLNYFKKLSIPIFSQLAFIFLLFSLKGNSDNFNLLGILQHTITIVLITICGYLALINKKLFPAFCIANLGLIFISTEIIGALVLLCGIALLLKSNHRFFYVLISILNVIVYYLGINYSNSLLHQTSSNFHFSIHFFQGLMIFMGGLFSNFKLIIVLSFSYLLIQLVSFLRIEGDFVQKIQNPKFFPNFLFLSVLFIGAFIQVGRTDNPAVDHAFNTSIAQRFSFYHLTFLLSSFLAIIQFEKFRSMKFSLLFLSFGLLFYSYNLLKTWNKLSIDKNRIYIDAFNYRFLNDNLTYGADESQVKRIVSSNLLYFPEFQDLKEMKIDKEIQVKNIIEDGQYTIMFFESKLENQIAMIQTKNNKKLLVPIIDVSSNSPSIKVSPNWLAKNQIDHIFLMKK